MDAPANAPWSGGLRVSSAGGGWISRSWNLRSRACSEGIDITQLPTWSPIDELRLMAHTVKHADGNSADDLKRARPELFDSYHANSEVTPLPFRYTRRVYRPLSGEDLNLTLNDLQTYGCATIDFWGELADVMGRSQQLIY
ncbi:hypothetical protein P0D69_44835 [Paraburkholderia sediminicola]|uniref:hypothetical protein n=1 Tax=Paraburkholderia sediminicola TaxID=458836 RepID=UPI0038BAE5C8